MESRRSNLKEVLEELAQCAGDAPFLALGQTVFWDEPMKAGVAHLASKLGYHRRFIAGVHDTDYFAKLPGGQKRQGQFKTFPHNDTTTKGLWSAAAEFSALFGSETVISRDALAAGGLRIAAVEHARPGFLDEATEAWGWRGVVSLDERAPIAGEVRVADLNESLDATFRWAVDCSLDSLGPESRKDAEKRFAELEIQRCIAKRESTHLSDYFKRLLPIFTQFAVGRQVADQVVATTDLLRFNSDTCRSTRFATLDLFIDPATRTAARSSYDDAIRGSSGLYELSRFGSGAIPFDLVIPGIGRGTIRLGSKAAVIMCPDPVFFTFKRPLKSVCDLAELVEARFGPGCTVVGKAVALIGMLAPEHVFIFHEGASAYVKHSRVLHQLLKERCGYSGHFNPILRVKYDLWDALGVACSWFQLPEPFRASFGTEELCAPSFAHRWREVAAEQGRLLAHLHELRRPVDLIAFLDDRLGGNWKSLATEYGKLQQELSALRARVNEVRSSRAGLYAERRALRQRSQVLQRRSGDQFRAEVFGQVSVRPEAQQRRDSFLLELDSLRAARRDWHSRLAELRRTQEVIVNDEAVHRVHLRRRAIELEAELKRLRLIRHAIISSKGLERASYRPSAWWFPLVSPDGLWYRETIESAEYYLEPLE